MLVGVLEPSVRYHSQGARILTKERTVSGGQFDWGGRLQKVTEAYKGSFRLVGNQSQSAKAERSLTARITVRAGWKHGLSDPTVLCGRAVAQRIKVTLRITG